MQFFSPCMKLGFQVAIISYSLVKQCYIKLKTRSNHIDKAKDLVRLLTTVWDLNELLSSILLELTSSG